MKLFLSISLLACLALMNPAFPEEVPSRRMEAQKPLFEGHTPIETYREELQKNRLKSRLERIQELRKTILASFEQGDSGVLQHKILDLGDECLNLHEVAEEENKLLKKIKKLGDKINTQCEKLSDKMESKGPEKSRERWKTIDERLDEMLGLLSRR